MFVSPFEDISGENIIKTAIASLKVLELKRYLSLNGATYVKIRPTYRHRWTAIKTLIVLDSLLIRCRVLKPEYFFVLAEKNNETARVV
jgi:hypothetical protein